jgi:hypothetical protein
MHYERAPVLQKEAFVAGATCRGFAPAPPGFSAFVPLPIRTAAASPLDRSRPLNRRSGCLPAWPYPPLSPALTSGESGPAEESPSPQGGCQQHRAGRAQGSDCGGGSEWGRLAPPSLRNSHHSYFARASALRAMSGAPPNKTGTRIECPSAAARISEVSDPSFMK